VYTIWDGDQLIDVGMAGRSLAENAHLSEGGDRIDKAKGVLDRLSSHA
jgi:hypothetical protein